MNKIPPTTGIPDRYLPPWNRPEDEEWQRKFSVCAGIARDGGLALLIGDRGTGKTRMAAEVCRDRLPAPIRYTTAMTVFLRIRQSYARKGGETELDIVESLAATWLLVIDEIQERSNSEWEDRIITHIIDRRYGASRPTIIIGNLTPQSMAANLGESIVSRVEETGGIIKMTGKSYRKTKQS